MIWVKVLDPSVADYACKAPVRSFQQYDTRKRRGNVEHRAEMRIPKAPRPRIHKELVSVRKRLHKCMLSTGSLINHEAKQHLEAPSFTAGESFG